MRLSTNFLWEWVLFPNPNAQLWHLYNGLVTTTSLRFPTQPAAKPHSFNFTSGKCLSFRWAEKHVKEQQCLQESTWLRNTVWVCVFRCRVVWREWHWQVLSRVWKCTCMPCGFYTGMCCGTVTHIPTVERVFKATLDFGAGEVVTVWYDVLFSYS